jgi:hypothetical protein
MQPLNLHPDGQARLSDWFRRDPDLSDVALVEELLHAVAWKHPYWEQWYTRTDPTTRDRMVWVREGLMVAIRSFPDGNPAQFSVVAIAEVDYNII